MANSSNELNKSLRLERCRTRAGVRRLRAMSPLTPRKYLLAAKLYSFWTALTGNRHATTVQDVLAARRIERQRVYSMGSTCTAQDALKMMLQEEITAVVVTRDAQPIGMVTQTGFLKKVALPERSARQTPLVDIMTPLESTAYALEGNTVESCMQLMAYTKCHHLPVLTDVPPAGTLLAVVTLPELVGLTRAARDANASAWVSTQRPQGQLR